MRFTKKNRMINWWNNRSISTVIVVSFGIMFAIILSLSTLIFTISVRQTLIQSVQNSNKKLVNQAITNIDDLNDLITSVSFYVAGETELRQMLKHFPSDPVEQITYKHSIRSYLTQLWMNRPEIVGITIYVEAIDEINESTIGLSSTRFLEQNGWLDELGNNRGVIINASEPISRGSNIFNSLSLVKIFDEQNQILGILSFEISSKNVYTQCMERSLASPNSILFAVNEDLNIVTHPDVSLLGSHISAVYPHITDDDELKSGLIKYNDMPYIQIVSRPSKFNWNVVELIPLEDVFDFRPLLLDYALLAIIAILISSVLTYILTKKLTQPIVDLSQAMTSDTPLEITLPDHFLEKQNEIGTLFRSYQMLTEHVTDLITKLQYSMENQKKLEINALRAQINPHFMYNCLDYINWKAQDKEVPEISRMLTSLSRFMRISLTESNLTCPLEAEIEHVRTYLEIFHVRYQGSFTYTISVDTSLLKIQVPQFILQPLVENSIMHGFGKNLDGGTVQVCVTRENDWLYFDIEDNGKGMTNEEFERVLTSSESSSRSGLRNINDRIRYLVSNEAFTGLQVKESQEGLHVYFAIYLIRKIPWQTR
jgi:two-component system sensor histidine kinase YesM